MRYRQEMVGFLNIVESKNCFIKMQLKPSLLVFLPRLVLVLRTLA